MSNPAIIGMVPEFVYSDGLKVDEVTVSFNLDSSVTSNTLSIYSASSSEFEGIKRLNIFRYFEDMDMLLPIETFHDEANNRVYAEFDGLGTFCLIDMEIWLDSLGISPEDSDPPITPAPAPMPISTFNDLLTTDGNYVQSGDDLDVVLVFYANGIDAEVLEIQKAELRQTSESIFSEAARRNVDAHIHYVIWTGTVAPMGDKNYAENYNEALDIIGRLPGINTMLLDSRDFPLDMAFKGIKQDLLDLDEASGGLRENSKRYCFVVDYLCTPYPGNTNSNAIGNNLSYLYINSFRDNYDLETFFVMNMYSGSKTDYIRLTSADNCLEAALGNGRINYSEFFIDVMFDDFVDNDKIKIFLPTAVKQLPDDFGDISQDSEEDYDEDEILDVDEINFDLEDSNGNKLITVDANGSVKLPTYIECIEATGSEFVKHGLTRFYDRISGNELVYINLLKLFNVLPCVSDPISDGDTDGDGISDEEEFVIETNRMSADTDGDRLSDGLEMTLWYDPLNKDPDGDRRTDYQEYMEGTDPYSYDKNWLEYCGDFAAGFVAGDFISEPDSVPMVIGQVTSSFVPLVDIRDVLGSLVHGDYLFAGINAVGLIPLVGDALSAARKVGKFAINNADEIAKVTDVVKYANNNIPSVSDALGSIDEFTEAASGLSKTDGLKITREGFESLDEIAEAAGKAIKKTSNCSLELPVTKIEIDVWAEAPFKRGDILDDMPIGTSGSNNIGKNFPVADMNQNRILISRKSLDIGAKSYQDPSKLKNALTRYVDKLKNFEKKYFATLDDGSQGITWGGKTLRQGDYDKKALEVLIPDTILTDAIEETLNSVIKEFAKDGIGVWFHVVA